MSAIYFKIVQCLKEVKDEAKCYVLITIEAKWYKFP